MKKVEQSIYSTHSKENLSCSNESDVDNETMIKLGLDSSGEDKKSDNSSDDDENFEVDGNTPIPTSSIPPQKNITSHKMKKKANSKECNKSQRKKGKKVLKSSSDEVVKHISESTLKSKVKIKKEKKISSKKRVSKNTIQIKTQSSRKYQSLTSGK